MDLCEKLEVCLPWHFAGHESGFSSADPAYEGWGERGSIKLPTSYHRGGGTVLIKAAMETLAGQGFDKAYLWTLNRTNRRASFMKNMAFRIPESMEPSPLEAFE